MPDSKITALASIGTGTDPVNDALVIVDVSDVSPGGMSATGTTKRVSLNNLLASSPTATLASATITGDLTVDTSTLYVSSSTDKVGIGTTSLSNEKLTVAGNISANAWLGRSNISVPAGDCSIFRSADNTLGFGIASSTAMTLNSTGLGVGVSPSYRLHVSQSQVGETNIFVDNQQNDPAALSGLWLSAYGGTWKISVPRSATFVNPLIFKFGSTEMMRLDASGNLLCGSTALNATWNTRLTLSSDSGTTRWAVGPYSTATNFVISAASGGGVYLNGTAATSWTSASDERLKDIIEPISNAIAKVGSLRAVIGKFKSDDTNTRKSFLMAQDVQSVLPEAVDASNPDRLGLAYTDVIPLLVAAIKELAAEVNALKNA